MLRTKRMKKWKKKSKVVRKTTKWKTNSLNHEHCTKPPQFSWGIWLQPLPNRKWRPCAKGTPDSWGLPLLILNQNDDGFVEVGSLSNGMLRSRRFVTAWTTFVWGKILVNVKKKVFSIFMYFISGWLKTKNVIIIIIFVLIIGILNSGLSSIEIWAGVSEPSTVLQWTAK